MVTDEIRNEVIYFLLAIIGMLMIIAMLVVTFPKFTTMYRKGYRDGETAYLANLIKHTELLTNIVAQQLQYEKSIATCSNN